MKYIKGNEESVKNYISNHSSFASFTSVNLKEKDNKEDKQANTTSSYRINNTSKFEELLYFRVISNKYINHLQV